MNCFDELSVTFSIDRMGDSQESFVKFFFIFTEKVWFAGFLSEQANRYGKGKLQFQVNYDKTK